MATWGGLNRALTAWRDAVMRLFPDKDTTTDGARADGAHSKNSQHQQDTDGTVDAYDCDINWIRSSVPHGNPIEDRISEALKLDFEQDPYKRSRLWIHDHEIASQAIDNWRERDYEGDSPHTGHIHFECLQAREDDGRIWPTPNTERLLRELRGEEGEMLVEYKDQNEEVKYWQEVLNATGDYKLKVDGIFGDKMLAAVNADRKKRGTGPHQMITAWHALRLQKDYFAPPAK